MKQYSPYSTPSSDPVTNIWHDALNNYAGSVTMNAMRGGVMKPYEVVGDAFGNALGNSIVEGMQKPDQSDAEIARLRMNGQDAPWTGSGLSLNAEQASQWGPQFSSADPQMSVDYSLGSGRLGTTIGSDSGVDFRTENLARMMDLANRADAGSVESLRQPDVISSGGVADVGSFTTAFTNLSDASPSMYADPRVVGSGYTTQGLAYQDWDSGARTMAVPQPSIETTTLAPFAGEGGGFSRNEAGALENFGRGWTSGGSDWSVLEGEKPVSYSLGGMARTGLGIVYDGLTGAGEFRQAGNEWDRGNYGRATIYGMAGVGTAGLTALTLGDYALAKASLAAGVRSGSEAAASAIHPDLWAAVSGEVNQQSVMRALRQSGTAEGAAVAKLLKRGDLELRFSDEVLAIPQGGAMPFGAKEMVIYSKYAGNPQFAGGLVAHEAEHFLQNMTSRQYSVGSTAIEAEMAAYSVQRRVDPSMWLKTDAQTLKFLVESPLYPQINQTAADQFLRAGGQYTKKLRQ